MTYLLTYLSDISSDISSVILSDKFSDTILEVRHSTLNSQDRGWGRGGGEEGEGEGGEGEETDIKSNNPHLTGGEKPYRITFASSHV